MKTLTKTLLHVKYREMYGSILEFTQLRGLTTGCLLGKLVLAVVKREHTRVGTTTLTIYKAVMYGIIEGIRPCGGSPLR